VQLVTSATWRVSAAMRHGREHRRSLSRVRIRPFEEADRPAVVDLWHRVGLYRPWNDPDRDIDRKLADSPWGMLVGVEEVTPTEAPGPADECVIATMMVGYDGHRGSVFYLAVDPAHQGQGLGTALMDHAEAMLLERGCPKAHASVRADNHAVIGFYEARGYQVEDSAHAVTLGRRLIHDDGRR
jgi:ribosomal protein S18 acetylase RimI-like enzyme